MNTNDASLLFPVSALTGEYYTASFAGTVSNPGLVAITAVENGTEVTVTSKTELAAGHETPEFLRDVATTLTLDAGDVLQLLNYKGDLTGTSVRASSAVQVIGGHYCVYVPNIYVGYCDHLEESMFPVEVLGDRYFLTAPAGTSNERKMRTIRVVALEPHTALSYEPAQPGAPSAIAEAGDFVELTTDADFEIAGDRRILVVEYMNGQEATDKFGDPSMTLAVPTSRFLREYLVHVPTSYPRRYVNIVAPDGADIRMDGVSLTGFDPIGTTGYALLRVALEEDRHPLIEGDEPFGLSVYGIADSSSFWYPGGLDLERD